MGKKRRGSGGGQRNADRTNGKAFKKKPLAPNAGATGRTVGGFSPAKLAIRQEKRQILNGV